MSNAGGDENDKIFYPVEKIVGVIKVKDNQYKYRIRWENFPPEEDTWEDEAKLVCFMYICIC